jgi:uroporphyrinogen-III decarboxylase
MEFAPAIYEHAAKLIGKTPWEVSRDEELLFHAHAAAFRTYHHRPVVVGIDIYNLEAEAYGAVVDQPDGHGIPAVSRHPCGSAAEVLQLAPFDPSRHGRIPMFIRVARLLADTFPEADVRVPVSGSFSVASNLMGFEDLLCEVLSDPDSIRRALSHLVEGQLGFCRAIRARGIGATLFESAATPPMLSPDAFASVELPALRALIAGASTIFGKPIACVMGGNTYPILDSLLSTGVGYVICPPETDQKAFLDKLRDHPQVAVRMSMAPQVIAAGNMEEIRREVDRLLALIGDRKNASIGAGIIPYETDPAVVLKTAEYVRSVKGKRKITGE